MLLIVGLGTPGPEHANTRHNIGFRAVDEIVRRQPFGRARRRFRGSGYDGAIAGRKVLALKPSTYVNGSGESVGAAVRFYKLAPEEVIVIHDELDLAPGKLRVKSGGGHAGHNGLRSINAHIGPHFRRVRIGIGHPGDKVLVTRYVLRDFATHDRAWVAPLIEAIADSLPLLVAGDDGGFMSRVALLTRPADAKEAKSASKAPDTKTISGGPPAPDDA